MFVPEWLIAVALTLFVLDIFVATECLTWAAFGVIATYVTWRLHPPFLWACLTFILVFSGTVVAYYFMGGRLLAKKILAMTALRGARKELSDQIVGQTGIVCIRSNQTFVRWNGELWPAEAEGNAPVADGQSVTIRKLVDGIVQVRPR